MSVGIERPRSVSERLLFEAYGLRPTHGARCACGGTIDAKEGEEQEAVRQHNRNPRHQDWRVKQGIR